MNRRKFLNIVGCCGCSYIINSCASVPITDRKQLNLIPEAKLNAQAAQIYEKVKKKEKLITDGRNLKEIKEIGKKMEYAISEYFYLNNIKDPTVNFQWEYILIDNKKVTNAWCMPGGKIAVYTGMLEVTKNTNALAAVMGHEIAHAVAKHSVERASRSALIQTGTQLIDIFSEVESRCASSEYLKHIHIDYGYQLDPIRQGTPNGPLKMVQYTDMNRYGFPQIATAIDSLGDLYVYHETGFIDRPGADRYTIGNIKKSNVSEIVKTHLEGKGIAPKPFDVSFLDAFDHTISLVLADTYKQENWQEILEYKWK